VRDVDAARAEEEEEEEEKKEIAAVLQLLKVRCLWV